MIPYIIQANIALILFYGAYYLFLKHETNFKLSRLFLLLSLLVSLFIPFLDLGKFSALFINEDSPIYETWLPDVVIHTRPVQEFENSLHPLWLAVLCVYFIGMVLNLLRIVLPLIQLRKMLRASKLRQDNGGWYYLLNDRQGSFSFFSYVFIGSKSWYTESDQESILNHERAHASCLHSWDVILLSLIRILFWFNPIVYMYRDALEQLHEYEADQIACAGKSEEYCELLARDTIHSAQFSIANHFNKSLTLRRITMIKSLKQKMSKSRKLGLIAAVLLIIVAVSCEEKIMTDLRKASGKSVLLSEYPKEVQDALNKIKATNPKADPKVYGLLRTEDLETLNLSFQTPTMVFKSDNPDYQLYVIVGADEIELPLSSMYEERNGEKIFTIVEEPAQPKTGMTDFYKFIAENMRYPLQARSMGVEGRVFVKFMVDENGNLSDFKVLRGIGGGCDAEALRVLSLSPAWNPGKQRGMAVKSTFNMAVIFRLENGQRTTSHESESDIIEIPNSDFGKLLNDIVVSAAYQDMDVHVEKTIVGGSTYLNGIVRRKLDNSPLPGVNLIFKGRTEGTITDSNGKFKVKAPVASGSIILSFVGFKSEEFTF